MLNLAFAPRPNKEMSWRRGYVERQESTSDGSQSSRPSTAIHGYEHGAILCSGPLAIDHARLAAIATVGAGCCDDNIITTVPVGSTPFCWKSAGYSARFLASNLLSIICREQPTSRQSSHSHRVHARSRI